MLSLKYKFERRIGLYPVAFDKDGVMYSSCLLYTSTQKESTS